MPSKGRTLEIRAKHRYHEEEIRTLLGVEIES